MSIYTNFINLFKKDPIADGNDTFNIETMLNENWDKIDAELERQEDDLVAHKAESATVSNLGHVKLPTNAITATLQNGWLHNTVATELKYSKDDFGYVSLSGDIKDGVATTNTVISILPIGYRPRHTTPVPLNKLNDGTIVNCRIASDGSLVIGANTGTGIFNLNVVYKAV